MSANSALMSLVTSLSRQEQKKQTRELIVETAQQLFVKNGILATKTSEIADEAGISHGSIFAHFHTRDELIEAVVEKVVGEIATEVRITTANCASVSEVLTAHLKSIARHEDIYIRLILEGSFFPRGARRTLVEIQSAISSRLEHALKHDLLRGHIRKISPDLVFNTWIGLLHHYLVNRDLFAPGGSVISKWGQKLLNHYLELVAPDKKGGKHE